MERNLQELYRRVAFNIYIGNTDDHFQTLGQLQNLAVSVGYMMEKSAQVDALLSSPSAFVVGAGCQPVFVRKRIEQTVL